MPLRLETPDDLLKCVDDDFQSLNFSNSKVGDGCNHYQLLVALCVLEFTSGVAAKHNTF